MAVTAVRLGRIKFDAEVYSKEDVDSLLEGKQNVLTFDDVPTQGSQNPVTSGGVYSAVGVKLDMESEGGASIRWASGTELAVSGGTLSSPGFKVVGPSPYALMPSGIVLLPGQDGEAVVLLPASAGRLATESVVDSKIAAATVSVYRYKGSVQNVSDLPATGNAEGDVWDVRSTGMNYGWAGEHDGVAAHWDPLGPMLTGYKTTQTAVVDPTSSGTSLSFIASITQDENGVITATKSGIPISDSTSLDSSSTVASSKALKTVNDGAVKTTGDQNVAGTKTFTGAVTLGDRNSEANVGSKSLANGGSVSATAAYAHAEGYGTKATEQFAHAEGLNTEANGKSSHAEGASSISTGMYSHAEGSGSESVEDYSHAEGRNTKSQGLYSHSEGDNTRAMGTGSHSGGNYTVASGNYSTALGFRAVSAESGDINGNISGPHHTAFVWQGRDTSGSYPSVYHSNGEGTFNIKPVARDGSDPLSGFFIGAKSFKEILSDYLKVETDPVFTTWLDGGSIRAGLNSSVATTKRSPIAIGESASATKDGAIAIGGKRYSNSSSGARAEGDNSVAIGATAVASGNGSVQIGVGINNNANTAKILGTEVVDANGKIPTANLDVAVVKTVNNMAPDANGNVIVSGGGGGSGETESDPVFLEWRTTATAIVVGNNASGTTGLSDVIVGNGASTAPVSSGDIPYTSPSVVVGAGAKTSVPSQYASAVHEGGSVVLGFNAKDEGVFRENPTTAPNYGFGGHSVVIGTEASTTTDGGLSIVIGESSRSSGSASVVIGLAAVSSGESAIAIGGEVDGAGITSASGKASIAIGKAAVASAQNAVQIGTGTNSVAGTLKFMDKVVLDASGNLPAARMGDVKAATIAAGGTMELFSKAVDGAVTVTELNSLVVALYKAIGFPEQRIRMRKIDGATDQYNFDISTPFPLAVGNTVTGVVGGTTLEEHQIVSVSNSTNGKYAVVGDGNGGTYLTVTETLWASSATSRVTFQNGWSEERLFIGSCELVTA